MGLTTGHYSESIYEKEFSKVSPFIFSHFLSQNFPFEPQTKISIFVRFKYFKSSLYKVRNLNFSEDLPKFSGLKIFRLSLKLLP